MCTQLASWAAVMSCMANPLFGVKENFISWAVAVPGNEYLPIAQQTRTHNCIDG